MAPFEDLKIYPLNSIHSASYAGRALASLALQFPESLPLYRRLQFGRFLDASCIITNVNCADPASVVADEALRGDERPPWLIAFVDRSCRPETELWMYGSWETALPAESNKGAWRAIYHLLMSLAGEVKALGAPESIHQDVLDAAAKAMANGGKGGEARLHRGPDMMLWGAVHEHTKVILQRLGLVSQRQEATAHSTFIFDIDHLPRTKPLPEGLKWGEVKPEHLALVRSRTMIPRQEKTLVILPSRAVYEKDGADPIAWAFVGLDGSLTSLHVEPYWRGQGLAKTLTASLFRDRMVSFHEKGMPKLAQAYVAIGNEQSEGMCKSLGGKSGWESYWLAVDLNEVI